MIEATSAPDLKIADGRVTTVVQGRPKIVAKVRADGLEVWCKVAGVPALISYEQLMSIPEFRAGILATLGQETV